MTAIVPLLFTAVLAAVGLYVLYVVIRAAVKGGILDAQREAARTGLTGGSPYTEPPAR